MGFEELVKMAKKKKNKPKKIMVNFLFEVSLPEELYNQMSKEDRGKLYDLNRLDIRWKAFGKRNFVFHLGDVNKINMVLMKYNYTLTYPERKELNRYGLTYSGESLDITRNGNDFVIMQRFPDGRIETHIIPEKRVWRVYYLIDKFFQKNPDREYVTASEMWDILAREFNINRFIDRKDRFHPNSFFGSRSTYHNIYYFPIKVLQHIGKIEYTKRGKISLKKKGDRDDKEKKMES